MENMFIDSNLVDSNLGNNRVVFDTVEKLKNFEMICILPTTSALGYRQVNSRLI